MATRKFVNQVKASCLPCYLSDNEYTPTHLYTDSDNFEQFKQLPYQNFQLESSKPANLDTSPSIQLPESMNLSKTHEANSLTFLDKKNLSSKLGRAVRSYLQLDSFNQTLARKRVKCMSVEAIMPEDLSLFYRYTATARQVKRMCDLNLWLLLEKIKERFRGCKIDSIQTLYEDLSRLIVNFVLSSDSELRFDKCKYILDRLEELENIIHDQFQIKAGSKISVALSPIPSLKAINSTNNAEDSLTPSKNSLEATSRTHKVPPLSLKSLSSNVFTYSNTTLPKTPTTKADSPPAGAEEKAAYKRVLGLIAHTKYTMAQMGHLLHYERLANPHIEKCYPKDLKKRWEIVIPNSPGCPTRNKRSDSQTYASFSTAIDVNLASIDLDSERPVSSRTEAPQQAEDTANLNNLMKYFYKTQTLMDDFEESIISRRKERLGKYCVWKVKKWAAKHKKEKVEQKYQDFEVVCKICAQKIKVEKLIDHSGLCRKMAELNKELKDLETKLGDILSDTSMRSKELHTQLLVVKKEYQRLKNKLAGKPIQLSYSPNGSLSNRNLSNMLSGDSVDEGVDPNVRPSVDSNARDDVNSNKGSSDSKKESCDEDNEELRRGRPLIYRSNTVKVESVVAKEEKNLESQSYGSPTRERVEQEFESPERLVNGEVKRKSFVEQLLDKCPQKYEGSPSLERDDDSLSKYDIKTKRINSMVQKKKFTDFLCRSKPDGRPVFYSDRPRTDSCSEGDDVDSVQGNTDEDKLAKITGIAEPLKFSADFSSSDKSLNSSPANRRQKVNTVYKKSKFYNGNELAFEGAIQEEAVIDIKKSVQNEEVNIFEEFQPVKKVANEEEKFKRKPRRFTTVLHTDRVDASKNIYDDKSAGRMHPQLMNLKVKIQNKRNAIFLYDVIKTKGKILLNQEPYQKKMEMEKDNASMEIENLKGKLEEVDIKVFADNFLYMLEKRIQVGKSIQDTQKSLDVLQGKPVEDSLDKKAIQKRLSLMRGNSTLSLTKKKLGFASTPTTLQPSTTLDDQISPFKSPISEIYKSHSSYSSVKMFNEFMKSDDKDTNNTNASIKRMTSQTSIDVSPGGKSEDSTQTQSQVQIPPPMIEKFKKLVESQQESLPELQEEGDDCQGTPQGYTSPFGAQNVEHSFNTFEKNEKKAEESKKPQGNVVPFSLDELISNSPRNMTSGSEYVDSKFMQSEDAQSNITIMQDDDTSKKQKEASEYTINILQESIIETPQEEEKKSPGTPSFEAPMIWRTSTAPARTLTAMKKQMAGKSGKNDLLNFVKNLAAQKLDGTKEENNNEEEDSTPPSLADFGKSKNLAQETTPSISYSGSSMNQQLLQRRLDRNGRLLANKKMATFEEEIEQENEDTKVTTDANSFKLFKKFENKESFDMKRLPSLFNSPNDDRCSIEDDASPNKRTDGEKMFAEDFMNERENVKDRDDSPILLESPLIDKGYYSDSHAKKVRGSLPRQPLIGINDFELIDMISKGAYGRVWLVRRKATNDLYAMKEINLAEKSMKNSKELESLRKENKIFGLAKEDFVVRAVFTFIHETYICFVMEYMLGGDFGDILYNYCALEEDVARFYIAEIVMALEYLHSLGTVHRDLKPDNILLDKRGHAKLTDFGLSETGLSKKMAAGSYADLESPCVYQKREQAISKLCRNKSDLDNRINLKMKGKVMERRQNLVSGSRDYENAEEAKIEKLRESKEEVVQNPKLKKPHRLIGTPDYMAPEIIQGQSITNYSIDWWSLGVMLFEFLTGVPPFNDDTPEKIYDNIVNLNVPWDQITIGYGPDSMSPEAADLIKKLLVVDHTQRLGANGADEIKQHPFFTGIDWEKLRTQTAPIVPERKGEIDTSNFVRLGDKLKKKDQENPFVFVPKDKNAVSNMQAAKELLEAASENFSIFNYAALDSDNLRVAEEALEQKEKELKQLPSDVCHEGRKGIFDDIFDMPH